MPLEAQLTEVSDSIKTLISVEDTFSSVWNVGPVAYRWYSNFKAEEWR